MCEGRRSLGNRSEVETLFVEDSRVEVVGSGASAWV